MPTTIAAAIAAGVGSLTAGFTLGGAVSWALKAGALLTLNHLLTERPDAPDGIDITRTATFSSGPAKWVLGRAKVGGVVAFWAEDWDVPNTEGGGGPGADDLHLVIALSEGECDAIEGVWIGDEFFKVKFAQDEQDKYLLSEGLIEFDADNNRKILKPDELFPPPLFYKRRDEIVGNEKLFKKDRWDGTKIVRDHSFPLDLDPGSEAYFDVPTNRWYDKPDAASRTPLDPDDEDDAEKIRRASLSGAISIWPYLNKDDYNNTDFKKFHSVRYYSDDVDNEDLNDSLGNDKATGFGDKWTENHRLDGIAAVHIRLRQWTKHEFEARVFKQGAPNLSFLIRGLRVKFPDPTTKSGFVTKWTDNAAAIRYWYHNIRRDINDDHIDRDAFVEAYDVCDKKTNPQLPEFWKDINNDGVGDFPEWTKDQELKSFRKYSINGVLTSGESAERIESEFDDHWQGVVVEDGGRLYYYPGAGRAVEPYVGTITKDMVLDDGSQSSLLVTPAPAISQRVNAVNLTMAQSSWHDFLKHSLIEIKDNEKIKQKDQDFLYPKNLGTWRWVINPVAANLLATINLRRARYSKTLSIKLPPGDNADTGDKGPVKFLAMSVGRIYHIEMPDDGIGEQNKPLRMMLLQKTINEDMTVNAVFIESPANIYDPNLELPRLEPPPPFVPSSQGAPPPKPKNLQVFPYTRTLNSFFIKATITPNNFRKLFRLTIGEEHFEREIPHDSHEVYFEVSVPHQSMTMTVWNVQGIGGKRKSIPLTTSFTPDFSGGLLPAPVWQSLAQQRSTLIATFKPEDYSSPITGMEIRYVPSGSTLKSSNWLTGTPLTASTTTIVSNRPIVSTIQKDKFTQSGQYTLYARFTTTISAVNGILSEISQGRTITINTDSDNSGTQTQDEADSYFPGASENLYQLTEKDRVMMLPDRPSMSGMSASGTAILMNGYTSATGVSPAPAWPFGACEGYNTNLTSSHRNSATELLTSNAVTWYRTSEVNLGATAKSIQVRAKFESFAPPYSGGGNPLRPNLALSTISSIPPWQRDSAISSITLGAATGGITPITYSLSGRPTGINFNPSTRVISGTPSAAVGTGTMTYTATDSASPPASRDHEISWTISASAPIQIQKPSQPSISSFSHNSASVSWTSTGPNASQITGYKIFYEKISNPDFIINEQSTTSTSYTITGLSAKSTYWVWIKALTTNTGYADSGNSTTLSFTTAAQSLTVGPTSFTLATGGLGKIKITGISANNAATYEIQWKLGTAADSTWGTNKKDGHTSNTYTIGNDENPLTNGVSYNVRIRGRRTGNDGAWATKSITTQTPASSYASNVVNKPTLEVKTSNSEIRMVVTTNAIPGTKKVEIEIVPVAFAGYDKIIDYFGNEVTKSKETYTKTVTTDTGKYEIITTHTGKKELNWSGNNSRSERNEYHSKYKNTRDLPDYTRGMQVQVKVKKYNATTGGESTEFSSPSNNFILSGHPTPPSSENYGSGSIPNPLTKNFAFADSGFKKYTANGDTRTYMAIHTNLNFINNGYEIWIYSQFTSEHLPGHINYFHPYFNKHTTFPLSNQSELNSYATNPPNNNVIDNITIHKTKKSMVGFRRLSNDGSKSSITINYEIPVKNQDNLPVYTASATGSGNSSGFASPTGLQVHLIEYNKALLIWESSPETDYHEIEHNGTPSENKTGMTGDSFVFEDLPIDSELTFKIKSHAGAVSTDFVDFDLITTGLVPEDDDIPFEFGSDTPLTFSKVNDSRNISYSFEAETEEVDFYQIRYWQSTDGRITNNDYALHDAQYITIDNTHAEGVETFTGTFDPGYSSRYYTAQIRAFVGTATDDYDRGFSAWHDLSNNESIGATTISNVFQNGRTLLTAPALSVEQSIDDAGRSVITGTFTDLSGEWEEPSSPNSTISVDISVVDGATDDYGNIGGIMRLYDTNDIPIVDDGQKPFATKFVFTKTSPAPSVDGNEWNFQINRKSKFQGEIDSNTANIVVDLPAAPPAPIAHVTPSLVGTDVKFTWEAIEGADGYEVSITEPTGLGESLDTSSVVQTSNAVEYVKVGGRNESFSISVRSYSGSANDRLFSTSLLYGYSSSIVDDASIGKVRSLTATADDDSTTIGWAPAMVATAYEYQSLTNEGTWGTSATTADTSIDISSVSDLTVRVRGFAGTSLTNPVFTSTSWSTISYKADTNPDASDVGDIRRLVGISKNNTIALEWDAADNATAYELEAYVSNAWTSVADDVEALAYSTTYASTESMNFRVRGVTDDDDGEWTKIAFTGDASISIDAPSVENHVTYTTINLNWEIVANAVSYDIEYRESTTPVSAWVKAEHSHDGYSLTIDGLKTNTLYNVRVRGTDGTNDSAWAVSNIRTMLAENLSAPSTITLVPTETDFIVSWTSVADATGYRVEISYSGFTSEHDVGAGDTQISFNADDFNFLVRPVKMTARVKSLFHDYDGGVYSDEYEQRWNEPDTKSAQIAAAIGSSVAGQASGAQIPVNASRYRYVENAPPNEKAMPYFSDSFETLVCNTGVAIDSYELPYPVGGVQPYTINISNLPNGLVFAASDRTISGTPTDTAPAQGYATVQLIDANNLSDTRPLKWVVGGTAPNTWDGTGTYADPYEISTAKKINIRSLLKAGSTNAADIEADTTGSRGCVVWFVCLTQADSIVRIHGADNPDFDIVAKRDDEFLFSDTTDDKEFIDLDGHLDGVMIGVYKYSATTTTTGANSTGDPVTLEWYLDDFDTPNDVSGEVGGASFIGYAEGGDVVASEYTSEQVTDVYLLSKTSPTDTSYTKTNLGTIDANGKWTAFVAPSNNPVRVFRLEVHLRKWKNRAMTGLTTEWKEI